MCHRASTISASSLHIHVSPWCLEENKKQRTIYWRVEGGREERDILNSVKSAPWREPILDSQSHCCPNAHHNCHFYPHSSKNTPFLLGCRSTSHSPQRFFTIEIQIEALQLIHLRKGKQQKKTAVSPAVSLTALWSPQHRKEGRTRTDVHRGFTDNSVPKLTAMSDCAGRLENTVVLYELKLCHKKNRQNRITRLLFGK